MKVNRDVAMVGDGSRRTCSAGGGARLQDEGAGATGCSMDQHGVARRHGINPPSEDYGGEALKQRGARCVRGHRVWDPDAIGGRHRHKLRVRGVAGGEAGNSVARAEAAL